jgi:histidine ammonia-lyase
MGSISARKTLRIIDNLEIILAIELLCAAQALDFRRPLKSSVTIEACHAYIRQKIPHLNEDVVLSEYINIALDIIKNKELANLSKKV